MLNLSAKDFSFESYISRTWAEETSQLPVEICQEKKQLTRAPCFSSYETSLLNSIRRKEAEFVWNDNYIETIQKNIIKADRNQIAHFIVSCGLDCKLSMRSIGLGIRIFDRLVQNTPLQRNSLKEIASACLFVAGKHEECDMDSVCSILASKLVGQNEMLIIETELFVWKSLNYNIQCITPLDYLEFYLRRNDYLDKKIEFKNTKKVAKAMMLECMSNDSLNKCKCEEITKCCIEAAKKVVNFEQISTSNNEWKDITEVLKSAVNNSDSVLELILSPFFKFNFDKKT